MLVDLVRALIGDRIGIKVLINNFKGAYWKLVVIRIEVLM